jgi:iron(III) transport system ATP-binding protein
MTPATRVASARSLDIRHLTKTFALPGGRTVEAVKDFTLRVEPGELLSFLGPSGCGKTTVLRILAGLESADGGDILVDGRSIRALPPHRRRVGMVFQNYALFPHLSVLENIAYSLRVRRVADGTVRAAVAAALESVGLEGVASRLPGQLSGGQQQRVAVARALVMHPDLLLFDEPLSNLDAKLRVQVRGELRRLQKSLGTTAIYVTHDQDEAMSLSDRIVVMNGGRVEQVGTPEEIYARPASLFVAGFVGQVNALAGRVVARVQAGLVVVEVLDRRVTVRDVSVPSDEVLVLVRPEAIRVGAPGSGSANAGSVEDVEFRGDRIEYRVRLGGALVTAVEASLQRRARIAIGDRVEVELVEQALHLLPVPCARNAVDGVTVSAQPSAP